MPLVLPGGESRDAYLRWCAPPVGGVLDGRVQRYGLAKARSLAMYEYLWGLLRETPKDHPGYARRARQVRLLRSCGTWLCFHYYYRWLEDELEGQYRLVRANFCDQHLLCNFCAIRRAAVKLRVYLERFHHILAQQPSLTPHLITLTVKNGPDLLERFQHLRACYGKLQQRRKDFLARRGTYTEFSKCVAGVGSYEFTYNALMREFHPHLHLIGLVNGYLHQLRMVEEWRDIAGDSFILDVRPFSTPDEPIKAFREVFKYALKFSQLPVALNYEVAERLQRKRLLVSFGAFWGTKVPKELTDDPLEQDYVEYFYEWITDQYRLQSVQHVEVGEVG